MKKVKAGLIGGIVGISAVALATGWFQNNSQKNPVRTQTAPNASAKANTSLKWQTDLEAALKRAQASGKPVFVDFYATWCPPCKIMDSKTFKDDAVKAELQNYELVKVDVDKSSGLASQFGIQALPTLVCLKPEGTRSDFHGYHSPENLLAALKGCTKYTSAAPGINVQ